MLGWRYVTARRLLQRSTERVVLPGGPSGRFIVFLVATVSLRDVQNITRRAFSRAHTSTLTFDLDLQKFNYLVPCGQG